MTTWIVLLILAWPAFWLIRVLVAVKLLVGLEFRREKLVPLALEEIPTHLREAALGRIAELTALGFELLGGWRCERSTDGALDEWAVVLNLPSTPVRAVVRLRNEVENAHEAWISLRTTTARGLEIITASYAPEALLPLPPGIVIETVPDVTAAALLERHRARIANEANDAWVCGDLAGAVLREQYLSDGVFEYFRASGWAVERSPGVLGMRIGAALGQARRLTRRAKQQKKLDRAKKGAGAAPALSAESLLAIDHQQYRQIGAVMNGKMSRRAKAVVSAVSFLLFAAVLGWLYSPVVAATLVVALVVHEGGHLLGMWIFGYRDTQLLFIPFFGGAAIGHDEKVLAPWKHIVIILLGPLPGLLAGLVALGYGVEAGGEWMEQAAFTAVFLNAFNLLPILPLDGGQIVDFAFASRFPRARVLFLAASATALVAMALFIDGVQLLLIAGLFTLLRLPLEWRLAGLRREVRREHPEGGDEETVVRRLLMAMRAPAWSKTPALQRLQHVRGLQLVLRMPRPGFATMCFAMAGYASPLWLGGPLALWAMRQKSAALLVVAEQQVREAGLERKAPVAVRLTVPDEDNAAVLYERAEALAREGESGERKRTDEAQVVELLRLASTKPAFVPRQSGSKKERERGMDLHMRGLLLRHLITAAEERLKFREPQAAGELALASLRLARLFDTAPGWWTWQNHYQMTTACWNLVEEIFALSPTLAPEFLRELKRLSDEERELEFAAIALPHDLVRQAAFMGEGFDEAGEDGELLKWLYAATLLFSDPARMRAETLQRAVTLDRSLKEIRQGKWPASDGEPDGATYQLRELAHLLARLRQARVAVEIAERRAGGAEVSSLDVLDIPMAQRMHPFRREPMQWTRRGNVEVIAFAAEPKERSGMFGLNEEVVWRFPAKLP